MTHREVLFLVHHVEPMNSRKGPEVHVEFEELEAELARHKSLALLEIERNAKIPFGRGMDHHAEYVLRQQAVGPRQTRSITDPKLIEQLKVGTLTPNLPPLRAAPRVYDVDSRTGRPIQLTARDRFIRDVQRFFPNWKPPEDG